MIRKSWNGTFVLLAALAMAIASHGFTQETNGSPDGLYVVPDTSQTKTSGQEPSTDRSAQSFLSSLDPQSERIQRDIAQANAAQQAWAARKKMKSLANSGGSSWTPWTLNFRDQTWIAILAGAGLFISMAAGGYVWWSHSQPTRGSSAVFLTAKHEPAAKPGSAQKQDKIPNRRAA